MSQLSDVIVKLIVLNRITAQTSTVQNILGWTLDPKRELFLAGPTREIPSGQDRPVFLCSGSQSERMTG